jgi:hypothetical protein
MALAAVAACGWPETRMEPVGEYHAAGRVTVTAAPAFTAGPDTVRTTSPDGSTVFACGDGRVVPGSQVPAHSTQIC